MAEPYRTTRRVLFEHCDPARIVFYPRYFELVNGVVEEWFREGLAHPFHVMIPGGYGVPTAQIEAAFHAPSRLGEMLDIALEVTRLGRTSLRFVQRFTCGDEIRVTAEATLVYVALEDGRPRPWPAAVRARLAEMLIPEGAA